MARQEHIRRVLCLALAADTTEDPLAVEITNTAVLTMVESKSRDHHAEIQAYVDSVAKNMALSACKPLLLKTGVLWILSLVAGQQKMLTA